MPAAPQPVSRLEEKMADKRGRILEAALSLFAERGYHGTAVPEVAEEAGVAAGTIYRYFPSKEALVNEVFRAAKGRLKARLLDGLDLKQAPRELFHDFWNRLALFAKEEPVAFTFLELQDHIPYLDQKSKNLEAEVLVPIWLALREFQMKHLMKAVSPQVAIGMVWGAFVGLMKAGRLGYFKVTAKDLEQAEQACWDAFALPADRKRA
ncbi:MAG: TetR/AcrR family transcriptional regulator [Bdellovibrionota bacterium]